MAFETKLGTFTPQDATAILERADEANVRIARSEAHQHIVEHLARIMREKRWRSDTGSVIEFDRDGRLRDGYRRMVTSVESGSPFSNYVTRWV
jgi:hypothetical protein